MDRCVSLLVVNLKDILLVDRESERNLLANASCFGMTPSTLPSYRKKSMYSVNSVVTTT